VLPGLEYILQIEGPTIDFRHPLMRSAVYHKASPAARRSAHLALADALANDGEQADRRAWHRAEAAPGPDEQIANELERSADRTLRRSGYAAAVRILDRAADLSPADSDRVRRMVAAADAGWRGGDALRARTLMQRAEQLGLTDPRARLNLRFLRGAMELRSGIPADGLVILLDALDEAASLDPPLAARMLAVAGEAAFLGGRLRCLMEDRPTAGPAT
jgi:hypothetical protein